MIYNSSKIKCFIVRYYHNDVMFVYAIFTWCLLCCFNELISSTITVLEFLEEYHIIIFRSVSLRLFLQLCTLASSGTKDRQNAFIIASTALHFHLKSISGLVTRSWPVQCPLQFPPITGVYNENVF